MKSTLHFRFSAGVLMLAALAVTSAAAADRPNILFIMTDQQYAEVLSHRMGSRYIRTPAMDSIAAGGTFFSRAYVANPICMPARNSIFTGRYPHEIGITANVTIRLNENEYVPLGAYFRRAGYETAYFGKWHLGYDLAGSSDHHGFDTVVSAGSRAYDDVVSRDVVEFLRRDRDRPFLAVASFMNPHDICEYARGDKLPGGEVGPPPPPDKLPPAPANLLPPRNEPESMTTIRKSYHASDTFPVGNFSVTKWRELRWAYYRLVEMVDAEIGKVLDALRSEGLEENTLIIFTSDHGECAGAHGFNQKTVFYDESTRVPLIVSLKGATRPGTSDRLVNTGLDILPTMLDFAGMEKPASLPGRSLRGISVGREPADWRSHVVVGNNMMQGAPVGMLRPATEGRMVRSERFKYCVFQFGESRESLVDLVNDPGEMNDLATNPAYRRVLLEHRDLLRTHAAENNDMLVSELLADSGPRPYTADGIQHRGR